MPLTQNFSSPTKRNFPSTLGRALTNFRLGGASSIAFNVFTASAPFECSGTILVARSSSRLDARGQPLAENSQTILEPDPRFVAEQFVGFPGVADELADLEIFRVPGNDLGMGTY